MDQKEEKKRREEEMEKAKQEIYAAVNKVLAKDRSELTETDKAFLRARREYIGRRERRNIQDILDEESSNTPPQDPNLANKQPNEEENKFPGGQPNTDDDGEDE